MTLQPSNAESQLNPTQTPNDVVSQPCPAHDLREVVPQANSNQHLAGVDDKNLVFNLESEQAPQIGDTNIHTTGPVYNAPVYQKYITQHVTVHQTYESPHCLAQLSSSHSNDEQTSPKLIAAPTLSAQREDFVDDQAIQHQTQPKIVETSRRTSDTQRDKNKGHQSSLSLMSLLKQRTREIASEESSLADFAERPIIPVELSKVSKPQQIDDEFQGAGHYRKREELVKAYERPESDITCEEMFTRAKEKAQQEAEHKFTAVEVNARQDYIQKHGNVVGVVGQAGIGKTTTAKKWAKQGLGGHLFGETSFFFYIVIRRIDFTTEMTLLQFLLFTMSIENDYSLKQEKSIHNEICSDPNVVLIFDGLDEAAFKSFSTEVPKPLLYSKSKAENYLKHLAGGNLLPRARKIFTSRPAPLYKLHPSYRPRFIVQILGLNQTAQDELGHQICGNKYEPIRKKLVQNRNVFAYCYVPVNYILTLNYLMNYDGDIQFVSLTRVLAFTCLQYLMTNHVKDQGELDKLSKLAWNGFQEMEIIFKVRAFKKAGISASTASSFTNTSVTKHGNLKLTILDGHKVRYFSHLIWQEFFAAFYLMLIMPLDEFELVHKQLDDDRWEVVSKFVFGIADPLVFQQLEPLILASSIDDWKQKKTCLSKFLKSKKKLNNQEIMRVCNWAHETNDPEIVSCVASLLPKKLRLRNSSLILVDIENLTFVIQHRATPLQQLDLSGNKIGNTGTSLLARCVYNIEELLLCKCEIRSEGTDILCDGVKKLTKPLKCLDLSQNKIGNSGAASLAHCVRHIRELFLQDCGFGSEGVEKLCTGVESLTTPMEFLYLTGYWLSDETAKSLARCVHNINLLKVGSHNFTAVGRNLITSKSRGKVQL